MPLTATFPLILPISLAAAVLSLGALGMLIATTFVLYRHANALGNLLEYPIWLVAGLLVPIATLSGSAHQLAAGADLGHGGDPRRGNRRRRRGSRSPCAWCWALLRGGARLPGLRDPQGASRRELSLQ